MTEKDEVEDNTEEILFSVNEYKSGYSLSKIPYYLPTNENGEVKDFEELVGLGNGEDSFTKLAMLKADLDNLGSVFSEGLRESISISRYATLSRMLNYFFSLYVNYSLKANDNFKDIYTVFSGGDDLCVIR